MGETKGGKPEEGDNSGMERRWETQRIKRNWTMEIGLWTKDGGISTMEFCYLDYWIVGSGARKSIDFLGPAWWAGWQGGLSSLVAKVFQEGVTTGAFQKWATTKA